MAHDPSDPAPVLNSRLTTDSTYDIQGDQLPEHSLPFPTVALLLSYGSTCCCVLPKRCRRRYPENMSQSTLTPETLALRALIDARREEFQVLLDRYGATNPKLFGSVARGTADARSDIDILVEMDPADGNLLMRASGLMEETRALFDRDDVDVFPIQLLKRPVSVSALADAVAL